MAKAPKDEESWRKWFPWGCGQCEKAFVSEHDLLLHQQGMHHKLSLYDKRLLKGGKIKFEADE